MWVKMTRSAHAALLHISANDERLYAEWHYNVERTPQRVLIEAPYIAWSIARDRLYRATFGPRGGKRRAAQREFSALKAIQTQINYVDKHPAFRGVGMLGWHGDVFPAWETGDPDMPWSPMPVSGGRFVILTPDWRTHYLGVPKSTVWEPRPSGVGRLADERTHVAFHHPATGR